MNDREFIEAAAALREEVAFKLSIHVERMDKVPTRLLQALLDRAGARAAALRECQRLAADGLDQLDAGCDEELEIIYTAIHRAAAEALSAGQGADEAANA